MRFCVRDAEGGETTPSFGHPSYFRRGKGGTAFGAERNEASKGLLSNLPIGRFTPTLPNEPHEAQRSGANKAGIRPYDYLNINHHS